MPYIFPKGTEVRDDQGKLLLTFVRDYTAEVQGTMPAVEDVVLPDGTHPKSGTLMPTEVAAALYKIKAKA